MNAATLSASSSRAPAALAQWLLTAMVGLGLGCWTQRSASLATTDPATDREALGGQRPTHAANAQTVETAGGAAAPAQGPSGMTADAPGSSTAPPAAHAPGSSLEAEDATPPDRAQVKDVLETLLASLEPSRRVQVLLVDDGDCFDSLARDTHAVAAMPEGVSVSAGAEDGLTSSDPSDGGFRALRTALAAFHPPSGRRLVHTRLYGDATQIGWVALCVLDEPFLDADDFLRQHDATSLTFGLRRAAEERVRAYEPTTARLAFTVDGRVVLAIAPLDALRLQQEPVFTLYR